MFSWKKTPVWILDFRFLIAATTTTIFAFVCDSFINSNQFYFAGCKDTKLIGICQEDYHQVVFFRRIKYIMELKISFV
jgi:hypothetical protein